MALTPDRRPGPSDEEAVVFEDTGLDPAEVGEIRRKGNDLLAKDGMGVFNLRAGSGLTADEHRTLLQLIHFIDEGPADGFVSGATKTVTGTVFPSQVLWKRADSTNLVEQNIIWTGVVPTTIQWVLYAPDGMSVVATVTDTVSYSGVFETSRIRAISWV